VFNDAFHIWCAGKKTYSTGFNIFLPRFDGHFGTINGLRLGRLPAIPVDWNEINAAWGYTLLLLHILAVRQRFSFVKWVWGFGGEPKASGSLSPPLRYRLVPTGSYSRLERVEDGKALPLYYTPSSFKLFADRRWGGAVCKPRPLHALAFPPSSATTMPWLPF
jgi:hypothetical protein